MYFRPKISLIMELFQNHQNVDLKEIIEEKIKYGRCESLSPLIFMLSEVGDKSVRNEYCVYYWLIII